MKLIFFLDTQLDAGSAKVIHALEMCNAYASIVNKVELCVSLGNLSKNEVTDYIENELGVKLDFAVRDMDCKTYLGRFKMLGGWIGARRLLPKLDGDIYITLSPLILWELVRRKCPVIYEAHNSFINRNKMLDTLLTKMLIRASLHTSLKSFVAISQPLKDIWQKKGVPLEKILIEHDAVNEIWTKEEGDIFDLREKLDIPPQHKVILYAGSLYPDRGIERVFQLAQQFAEATFVVVGGPAERALELRELLSKQIFNNVRILGRVPHRKIRSYLKAADILLMIWSSRVPTIKFCSPMKLFEYMSAGRIIVGDGYPTIHEVVTDGKHVLLAEPKNFNSLVNQLETALEMPPDHPMARTAKELVVSVYTWQLRAKRILDSV